MSKCHHGQKITKVLYVIHAGFEFILEKMVGCGNNAKRLPVLISHFYQIYLW